LMPSQLAYDKLTRNNGIWQFRSTILPDFDKKSCNTL